jgi:hypothetical protein
MIKPLSLIGLLSLLIVSVAGSVRADSVTASSSLSWASATFSGAVAPAPVGGTPGAPSTVAGAFYGPIVVGYTTGCANDVIGWTPAAVCNVQAGPNDYATASSTSEFQALASASSSYSSLASVERDGTIVVGTNGVVDITIPFTATITPNNLGNCGPSCIYFAQVAGYIFLQSQESGPPYLSSPILEAQISDGGYFNLSGGSTSTSGLLSLSDTGLTPGTYQFDVQTNSEVQFLPEPGAFLLLAIGLAGLAAMFIRKRFA